MRCRGSVILKPPFPHNEALLHHYMNTSDAPASAEDVLVDDSKEAQIQEFGDALKGLEAKEDPHHPRRQLTRGSSKVQCRRYSGARSRRKITRPSSTWSHRAVVKFVPKGRAAMGPIFRSSLRER